MLLNSARLTRMVAHSVALAVQGGTFFTPEIFKLAAPYIIISGNIGHMFPSLIYLSSSAALRVCIRANPSWSQMFCNTLCFF